MNTWSQEKRRMEKFIALTVSMNPEKEQTNILWVLRGFSEENFAFVLLHAYSSSSNSTPSDVRDDRDLKMNQKEHITKLLKGYARMFKDRGRKVTTVLIEHADIATGIANAINNYNITQIVTGSRHLLKAVASALHMECDIYLVRDGKHISTMHKKLPRDAPQLIICGWNTSGCSTMPSILRLPTQRPSSSLSPDSREVPAQLPASNKIMPGCITRLTLQILARIPAVERIRIIRELRSALMQLHNAGLVNGAITLNNILVDVDHRSYLILTIGTASSLSGTKGYMDPIGLQTGILTQYSDVYSFGIVALQLLTGRGPCDIRNVMKRALDEGVVTEVLDQEVKDWPIYTVQILIKEVMQWTDLDVTNRASFYTLSEADGEGSSTSAKVPRVEPRSQPLLTSVPAARVIISATKFGPQMDSSVAEPISKNSGDTSVLGRRIVLPSLIPEKSQKSQVKDVQELPQNQKIVPEVSIMKGKALVKETWLSGKRKDDPDSNSEHRKKNIAHVTMNDFSPQLNVTTSALKKSQEKCDSLRRQLKAAEMENEQLKMEKYELIRRIGTLQEAFTPLKELAAELEV